MAGMKKYEILPHTADGKFRAYGRTLEEAFVNAALATASLMWDWDKVEPKLRRAVRVDGRDREQLLVGFLGEIIYLLDTERFLLGAVERIGIRKTGQGWSLEGVLLGDVLSDRYEIHADVKAVTYNDMRIEEGEGFALQVVVDM
jgi:SHS2 domain-containing protein